MKRPNFKDFNLVHALLHCAELTESTERGFTGGHWGDVLAPRQIRHPSVKRINRAKFIAAKKIRPVLLEVVKLGKWVWDVTDAINHQCACVLNMCCGGLADSIPAISTNQHYGRVVLFNQLTLYGWCHHLWQSEPILSGMARACSLFSTHFLIPCPTLWLRPSPLHQAANIHQSSSSGG